MKKNTDVNAFTQANFILNLLFDKLRELLSKIKINFVCQETRKIFANWIA